jgi:DNA-binding NtrC family response regulator
LATGKQVTAADLRPWLIDPAADGALSPFPAAPQADSPVANVGMRLEDMERRLIESTLDHFGGHRAKAAQALGIGIRTLTNKLRQYGYAPRARTFGKAA